MRTLNTEGTGWMGLYGRACERAGMEGAGSDPHHSGTPTPSRRAIHPHFWGDRAELASSASGKQSAASQTRWLVAGRSQSRPGTHLTGMSGTLCAARLLWPSVSAIASASVLLRPGSA